MKIELEVPKEFIEAGKEVGMSEEELKDYIKDIIEMTLLDPYFCIEEFKETLKEDKMLNT